VELASRHPSGAQNFEVAPRFLENLCTPYAPNMKLKIDSDVKKLTRKKHEFPQ
jgi:hypothetical protein